MAVVCTVWSLPINPQVIERMGIAMESVSRKSQFGEGEGYWKYECKQILCIKIDKRFLAQLFIV